MPLAHRRAGKAWLLLLRREDVGGACVLRLSRSDSAFEGGLSMTIFKDDIEAQRLRDKIQFRALVTNLMKGGLSASELIEIVHKVEETLSEGQPTSASNGQLGPADAQPPMPEGPISGVRKDHTYSADGLLIASGEATPLPPKTAETPVPPAREPVSPILDEGQWSGAHEGHRRVADVQNPIASGTINHGLPAKAMMPVSPTRDPTESDLAAMERAADVAFWQVQRLRNKAWTSYRFCDLAKVRTMNTKENMLINEVIDYGRKNRISDTKLVYLNLPAREARAMMKKIDGMLLAHAKLTVSTTKQPRRIAKHG